MTQWAAAYVALKDAEAAAHVVASGVTLDLLSAGLRKWAADPARDDYDRSTRVRRTEIDTYLRAPEDASPLAHTAVALAHAGDIADAYVSAALRAHERYLGALEAKNVTAANARRVEEREYAQLAGANIEATANTIVGLDQAVGDLPTDAHPNPFLLASLPDHALARLYLGGVPVSAFRRYKDRKRRPWSRDVATRAASQLRETGAWFQAIATEPNRRPPGSR
jgi:hypothetical protein